MKIEGRTFLVSGGASGLGKATVLEILKAGGYASILDFNQETGEALVKELGNKVAFFKTDVRDSDNIAAAVQGTVEWVEKTGKPIGGVVAAAGVGFPGKVSILHSAVETDETDHRS